MGRYGLGGAALAFLAALPLHASAAGQSDDRPLIAQAKKPECVPIDSDKGPKANPCLPGYMPAPGSKVPPLGSTDVGGAGAPGAAGGDKAGGGNRGKEGEAGKGGTSGSGR